MSKVRAYKIADELGIDRTEFLKRAKELGYDLRTHMVAIEEDEAQEIRRRLAAPAEQRRVEKRVGSTVIRRRRRETPEVGVETAEASAARELAAAGEEQLEPGAPTAPPPALGEPLPVPEPAAVQLTPPLAEGPAPVAQPAAPGPVVPPVAGETEEAPGRREPAAGPRVKVRREIIETVNLKEQESIARAMRDKAQLRIEARRTVVEQQSRMQSRHRRAAGVAAPRKSAAPASERKRMVRVAGVSSLADFSRQVGIKIEELLRRSRDLGLSLEREGLIEVEPQELLAADLGLEVVHPETPETRMAARGVSGEDLEPRAPVVTVMGHVDHGKTTLLDRIRKTDVAGAEPGGITQHIGAYQVHAGSGEVTFLDTPGHAAFTQMRARGAQVTDIAILVVAADDGIMPQTVEAIDHARAAGVPVIVAINKVDRAEANVARVKQQLLEHQLVAEDFGGDTICVEVSAAKGTNIEKLLEMIHLQAEVLELRARAKGPARGVVIEAQLDRGRGPLATVLVREGTLQRGDIVVVGTTFGRLRALMNERGETLKEARPSTPVQLVGLSAVPAAGDELVAVGSEREAREIVQHRIDEERRATVGEAHGLAAGQDLFAQLGASEEKQLLVVLKTDVRGTAEAVEKALQDLSTERVKLRVIHSGVGAISESDVMLAAASKALVIGFHVRPEPAARKTAEQQDVEIRTHDVVYHLLDDASQAMAGLLPPKIIERISGHARVEKLFPIPRVGTIAGCALVEGTIHRSDRIRVMRDGVVVYTNRISSLRRFKDDVREVQAPLECGIGVENFNDLKPGDILEAFVVEEKPDTL